MRSSRPFSSAADGVRGQLLLGGELAQDAQRVARGVVVVGRQRAAQAGCRALERRGLPERPADTHVDVRRRRAVHSGDLHEAAERDRSDAVLDAVAGVLPDRRREPDVEPPRPHAEHERDDEVAQLVHEDQHAEAHDRDEDGHAGWQPPGGEPPRLVVGSHEVVEVARGRAVDASECLLDHGCDIGKREPALQERGDGNLVGGVVRAGRGPSALARGPGQPEQRKGRGRRPPRRPA